MAQPQRKASHDTSTVGSCTATNCRHNEHENCTAGEIRVTMHGDGHATCETYAPEQPKARP